MTEWPDRGNCDTLLSGPARKESAEKETLMQAYCSLQRLDDGHWQISHSSSTLGDVDLTDDSREKAISRMQRELQYRLELCPCSGVSAGTVEIRLNDNR